MTAPEEPRTSIVLDSNVLISHPEILSRRPPERYRLVLPETVLYELARWSRGKAEPNPSSLIASAAEDGLITLARTDWSYAEPVLLAPSFRASADAALLATAKELATRGPVLVATEDRDVQGALSTHGIGFVSAADLKRLLQPSEAASERLTHEARTVVRAQWRSLLLNLVIGAIASILANLAFTYVGSIVTFLRVWGVLLLVPVVGLLLYWLRCHFRLAYGIAEVLVGSILAIQSLLNVTGGRAPVASTVLQALGGLYVIVRGLDNTQKGLQGTRLAPVWDRLFPS